MRKFDHEVLVRQQNTFWKTCGAGRRHYKSLLFVTIEYSRRKSYGFWFRNETVQAFDSIDVFFAVEQNYFWKFFDRFSKF